MTVVVTVWEVSGGNSPAECSPLAEVCRPGILPADHNTTLSPADTIPEHSAGRPDRSADDGDDDDGDEPGEETSHLSQLYLHWREAEQEQVPHWKPHLSQLCRQPGSVSQLGRRSTPVTVILLTCSESTEPARGSSALWSRPGDSAGTRPREGGGTWREAGPGGGR